MNVFLFFLGFLALASAQVGVPGPRWQGPLADNPSGQNVQDTPEVARAKAQLQQAYTHVEAVLPVLPPEIRFQMGQTVQPIQQQQQNFNHQQNFAQQQQNFVPQQQQHFQQPNFVPHQQQAFPEQPQQVSFDKFAEEIPRSELGEVPEVAAARKAHLAAVAMVQRTLPPLESNSAPRQQPQIPQQQQFSPQQGFVPQQQNFIPQQQNFVQQQQQVQAPRFEPAMVNVVNGFVQDTPEVAAAKASFGHFG